MLSDDFKSSKRTQYSFFNLNPIGTNKEEFTCVAANVPKHGKFVWKLGDKVMENTNAVQDTSEDGETVLSQTYNIDFTESDTLEIINALNNKKISCR